MAEKLTIAQAAESALIKLGRPSSVREIYEEISRSDSYLFNTDVPEHVLRTEIRRKTESVERVDSSQQVIFYVQGDENYGLLEKVRSRANTGMKRIRRDKDKKEIVEVLTSDSVGLFREIWRLLLFSAMLGYRNNRRDKLESADTTTGIDQSSFGNSPAWPGILYLLSVVESNDVKVLTMNEDSEHERITMFEEYANGGLAIIREHFASHNESLNALIEFVQLQLSSPDSAKPNLDITL